LSSFIDLMADVRWSERDISNRMRELIRAAYPDVEWDFIVQKMLGAFVGLLPGMEPIAYTLSEDEQDEIVALAVVLREVQLAGRAAREDMALLAQTLDAEAAQARLARPQVEPVLSEGEEPAVLNQPELDADAAERAAVQALLDAAPQPVLDLMAARAAARSEPQ
jgi:hypothetical protein